MHVREAGRAGRKRSHWMWFVFPQLAGLGRSPIARTYAIGSLTEAEAYLEHPVLGPRLRECCEAVLAVEGDSLFAFADPGEPLFRQVLDRHYAGAADPATEAILNF